MCVFVCVWGGGREGLRKTGCLNLCDITLKLNTMFMLEHIMHKNQMYVLLEMGYWPNHRYSS